MVDGSVTLTGIGLIWYVHAIHDKVFDNRVNCGTDMLEQKQRCFRKLNESILRFLGNRTCSEREFLCKEGRCIPLSQRCDGDRDCKEGMLSADRLRRSSNGLAFSRRG